MLSRERDGKTVNHQIDYFNGLTGPHERGSAVEIHPNEEYWESVMGLREALSSKPKSYSIEQIYFFDRYWVKKELYQKVTEKCETLGIPKIHADNLAIPLSDFGMAEFNVSIVGSDIQSVAKESVALKEMFRKLSEDPLLNVTAIKFELGHGPLPDGKGGIGFLNKSTVSIKKYRALLPFMAELKRILQTDEQFRAAIFGPTVANYDGYSYPKNMRMSKESYLVDVYNYLLHSKVAKSKHQAGGMAWQFMSIVSKEFADEQTFKDSQKVYEGYGQYNKFVGDEARKKVKAYFRKMEKNL